MRLYIAGPMTGIKEFNYPEFLRAEEKLAAVGFQVFSPHRIDELFPIACGHSEIRLGIRQLARVEGCEDCASRNWQWYMRKAVVMLAGCDNMALLPRWQISRGAKVEHDLGVAIGMNPMYVDAWLLGVETGTVKL